MGNCLPFFKLTKNKYQERLETPSQKLDNIQLLSEEYISSLSILSETS